MGSDDQGPLPKSGGLVSVQHYSGPLPHPDMLERYEHVHPGAAERIITVFEREAEHRREIQRDILDSQIAREREEAHEITRGQYLGFLIGVIAIVTGGMVAVLNPGLGGGIGGSVIGGGGVIGLVTVFILGRKLKPPDET